METGQQDLTRQGEGMSEQERKLERLNMLSRRQFLGVGGLALGAVALGACGTDDAVTTTTGAAAPETTAGATATT